MPIIFGAWRSTTPRSLPRFGGVGPAHHALGDLARLTPAHSALPFIAGGALAAAFGAQKTVELVEERCVDPAELDIPSTPYRVPSRPFWATSTHNLSSGVLQKVFGGHVSTADAEVRKGAALVAAQAAEA